MLGEKARWDLRKEAVLNKSLKQHLTKQQLYSHLPPISQTEQNMQNSLITVYQVKYNQLL